MSQQEEEPLDPAVEAIRVKMVRLLAISGGIMMLGLMAVLGSIVYKVTQDDVPRSKPAAVQTTADTVNQLTIPTGAQILQSSQSDGRLMLTLKLSDGSTQIQLHNLKGTLIATYAVREQ
ncbi:MAG: fimbrial protein [Rhizobiaceae bacterium]